MLDETHDPLRRSWVESAQAPGSDFPIQNLPFGLFRAGAGPPRVGVAIGDQVLDVAAAGEAPADLNAVMDRGRVAAAELRRRLSRLLSAGTDPEKARAFLHPQEAVEMLLPARIGDFTDFYASIHHATRVGRLLRPENPLLPNYKYMPIAYHGRASSIVVGGGSVRRPRGQRRPDPSRAPEFGPTRSLDFELEAGFFVGAGNSPGEPIPVARAEAHLFGLCLLNDWSARDLQAWEYQPLGPFLAKNFATTISSWVVTLEALEPFRVPTPPRPAGDPPRMDHLSCTGDAAFDVTLQAFLSSAKMREGGMAPVRLAQSNLRDLYWAPAQLVAHHTSNGCNLRPGDLLGSGTVSGPTDEARGCLLERTEPLELPTGETRRYLEDGDRVTLRGFCERPGFARIGFGACEGTVGAA